jgi:hypothetical protein
VTRIVNGVPVLTVGELRAALAELPDGMPVLTEGCDCYGAAGGVETTSYCFELGGAPESTLLVNRILGA